MAPGESVQFTAPDTTITGSPVTGPVEWTASGGSIDDNGVFTSSQAGTYTVRAGRGGKQGRGRVRVNLGGGVTLSRVEVSPGSASVAPGGTQQFSAVGRMSDNSVQGIAVVYAATGGSITAGGLYTAGSTAGSFRVIATGPGGKADTATVTIATGVTLAAVELSPASVSVAPGGTQQFNAVGRLSNGSTTSVLVTYAATGGSITPGGRYTAGATAGTFRVIATRQGDTMADTSTVTITAPPPVPPTVTAVLLTPGSVSLVRGTSQQFSAVGQMSNGSTQSIPITWTATGGTVTSDGLYTAGTATGTFRVIARHSGGTRADTSAITVTAPAPTLVAVELTPASVSLQAGATQQFSVVGRRSDGSTQSVSPTFTATGGTVSSGGLYTAGGTAGTYRVIASASGFADTSSITISNPPSGAVTILSESFEGSPNLDALFGDRAMPQNQAVVLDPARAHNSSGSLEVTYPAGSNGGWLTRFFMPGYSSSARIGAWLRLEPGWQGDTRIFRLLGAHVSDQWSAFGIANICPENGKPPANLPFFSAGLIVWEGSLRFMAQFPGMPRQGSICYSVIGTGGIQGEASYTPQNFSLAPGQWYRIEFEVVMNTPGVANGSMRFWVDGQMRGEWTQIRWRDTPDVRLNSGQIEMYNASSPRTQRLWLDDVSIVATP